MVRWQSCCGDRRWSRRSCCGDRRWIVTSFRDHEMGCYKLRWSWSEKFKPFHFRSEMNRRRWSYFTSDQRWWGEMNSDRRFRFWSEMSLSLFLVQFGLSAVLVFFKNSSVNNWSSKHGLVQNFYITVRFNISSVQLS